MGRRERIVAGVVGLLVLAWVAPGLVGALLMLFSVLVFVIAVVGLVWPSLVRLPDRMAAVWAFALSVGMFVGGGMLLAPQNGESTASDVPTAAARMPEPETPAEREARIRERTGRSLDDVETRPLPPGTERRPPAAVPQSPTTRRGLVERMTAAEGTAACNVRLSDAARLLASQGGAVYRWMSPHLDVRFPGRRETGDPAVVTYWGRALQFQDEDGSWVRATYECDFNHDTGEIVDVRTREG